MPNRTASSWVTGRPSSKTKLGLVLQEKTVVSYKGHYAREVRLQMDVIHTQEQDLFECFGIPAHVWELPPEARPEERVPHRNRRDWVYREMAMLSTSMLSTSVLGADMLPWLQEPAESQSSASAESAVIPIFRQSSSR